MTTPYQHELDDLGHRVRSPGVTRPHGVDDDYLTWRYATQNQVMPGEARNSRKNRLYGTLCCGSAWGIVTWLVLGAGVIAAIAILLVKAFSPAAFGGHADAASTTSSSIIEPSTTTITLSPSSPSISTTVLSTVATETETEFSTTTQTQTTEEKQTTTITYTPPTTATATETSVATSVLTSVFTTEVSESFRTSIVPTTETETSSITATASETTTATTTAVTTSVTTAAPKDDDKDDDDEGNDDRDRRAFPVENAVSDLTSRFASVESKLQTGPTVTDAPMLSRDRERYRSETEAPILSELNKAISWCSDVMAEADGDDVGKGVSKSCEGYDSKSVDGFPYPGVTLHATDPVDGGAVTGMTHRALPSSSASPVVSIRTIMVRIPVEVSATPCPNTFRTIVSPAIAIRDPDPTQRDTTSTAVPGATPESAFDTERLLDIGTNNGQPITVDKQPMVGTCLFFAGHLDCVKHHNRCWGALVGVGAGAAITTFVLAVWVVWPLTRHFWKAWRDKKNSPPAPQITYALPPTTVAA
ncbi:uncharacterized protein AB675_5053 [Cyphellophora attinorum]|uniref:Uncharacterized protein n=1 Tax=Cyphellophora attinorum TaxID=1664694 RepID=A0A0N1H397_9EURO|nr:uncharacterized protein AB675_5053 [Phialophora attinorum]KPI39422.1 hypothetical protein AB675_5053 [Phialophora attinorum]